MTGRGGRGPSRSGPTSTGDFNDPVAQSIRNQQNRDAAPSKEEVEQKHRDWLTNEGCYICGEDDPDKLSQEMPVIHNCKGRQQPRPDPRVVCEDRHPSRRQRWRYGLFEKAIRKDAVAVAIYECDLYEIVTVEEEVRHICPCGADFTAIRDGDVTCPECSSEDVKPHPHPQRGREIPKMPALCPNTRNPDGHEIKDIYYRGSDF